MRGFSGLLGAFVALWLCADPDAALAQKSGVKLQSELDESDGEGAKQPAETHPEGEYGGVVPGHAPEPPKTKHLVLTWIGFQNRGAGSRLFVQLTRDAEFDQKLVGNELVVTIAGARFGDRNARRRLDMRFFETSLRQVIPKRARRRGKGKGKRRRKAGIELHISFKNPADARTASAQLSKEKDGYHYLYLEFGPGTPAPDAAP